MWLSLDQMPNQQCCTSILLIKQHCGLFCAVNAIILRNCCTSSENYQSNAGSPCQVFYTVVTICSVCLLYSVPLFFVLCQAEDTCLFYGIDNAFCQSFGPTRYFHLGSYLRFQRAQDLQSFFCWEIGTDNNPYTILPFCISLSFSLALFLSLSPSNVPPSNTGLEWISNPVW